MVLRWLHRDQKEFIVEWFHLKKYLPKLNIINYKYINKVKLIK